MKAIIALAAAASAGTIVCATGSEYYQTYNYESDYNPHTPLPAQQVCGDVSAYPEPPAMDGYYYDNGDDTYYPSYDTCENWEGSCPDDTNACRYVQMYSPKQCKSEAYHRGCKECYKVCCKKVYRPRPPPIVYDDYEQPPYDGGPSYDNNNGGNYGDDAGGYSGGSTGGNGYKNGPTSPSNYGDSGSSGDSGNNY